MSPMTYNFDPDRWYEDQQRLLEKRRREGTLEESEYDAALKDLERRYEEMLDRLQGTYQLPPSRLS